MMILQEGENKGKRKKSITHLNCLILDKVHDEF